MTQPANGPVSVEHELKEQAVNLATQLTSYAKRIDELDPLDLFRLQSLLTSEYPKLQKLVGQYIREKYPNAVDERDNIG